MTTRLSKLFAIISLILLVIGLTIIYTKSRVLPPTYAMGNYSSELGGNLSGFGCRQQLNLIIDINTPKYVGIISENDSLSILAREENGCDVVFSINAPNFDVSPSQSDPLRRSSISWVLTPRKTGEYQIVVEINDTFSGSHAQQNIEISVRDVFGLKPAYARALSYIGTFLGPIGTLPWWYEQWQKRRSKKKPRRKKKST